MGVADGHRRPQPLAALEEQGAALGEEAGGALDPHAAVGEERGGLAARPAAGWRGGSLSVWRNAAIASAAVRSPAGSATTDGGGPVGPSFMSEKTTSRVALKPSAVSSGGSTQKVHAAHLLLREQLAAPAAPPRAASRLGADDACCSSAASATQSAPGIRGHSAQLGGHTAAGSGGGGSGSVDVVAGEP